MKVNYRIVLGAVGLCVLLGVATYVIHRMQVRRSTKRTLDAAVSARLDGASVEAIRNYQRYLRFKPFDDEARAALGNLLLSVGKPDDAYLQLAECLRQNQDNGVARTDLVRASMQLGRFDDAIEQLEDKLIPGRPEDAKLQWMLGMSLGAIGRQKDALAPFRKAAELEPSNPEFAFALAEGLIRDKPSEWQEPLSILNDLVIESPDNAEAYLARARWIKTHVAKLIGPEAASPKSRLGDAWTDAMTAVKLAPTNLAVLQLAIQLSIETGRDNEIDSVIEEAIKTLSTNPAVYLLAAEFEFSRGDNERALAVIERGLKNAPGNGDLLASLARVQLAERKIDEAEKTIGLLQETDYPKPGFDLLQAALFADQGKYEDAISQIDESRSKYRQQRDSERNAVALLSFCYGQMGSLEKQVAVLEQAVSENPTWLDIRSQLADALAKVGRVDEALLEYGVIVNSPDVSNKALFGFATLLLAQGSNDNRRMFDQVEELIAVLERREGAADSVNLLRAELLSMSDEPDQAREQLEQLVLRNGSDLSAWVARIRLEVASRNWDQAAEQLARAKKAVGDVPGLRLLEANLLVVRDGDKVSRPDLEKLANTESAWSKTQTGSLLFEFSKLFYSLGDFDLSKQVATQSLDFLGVGQSREANLLLFDLEFKSQNLAGLKTILDRIAKTNGADSTLWRIGEAIRLSMQASQASDPSKSELDLNRALGHLADASIDQPDLAQISRVKGGILLALGRTDEAIESYIQAISNGSQGVDFVEGVLQLLNENRRYTDADLVIRTLQSSESSSISPRLSRTASEVSLRLSNFKRAIGFAESQAKKTGAVEDRIWLAQVCFISGDADRADRELQAVREQFPENPVALLSLIQLKISQGDQQAAERLVEEGVTTLLESSDFTSAAQACDLVGDRDKAIMYYNQALDQATDETEKTLLLRRIASIEIRLDERSETSRAALEKLVDRPTGVADANVRWGRRVLATVLANEGGEANLSRAMKLVEANLQSAEASNEDQRTLAILISSPGDKPSVLKAIEMMEEMTSRQSNYSLEDRFALAKMYGSLSDWDKCNAEMRRLMANGGAEQRKYVLFYIKILLTQQQLDEAELWIGRLRKLDGGRDDADSLYLKMLLESEKYNDIEGFLTNCAENPERIGWCAEGAEALGNAIAAKDNEGTDDKDSTEVTEALMGRAEEWFRRLSDENSNAPLALAAFYARQGRIKDLAKCEGIENGDQFALLAGTAVQSGKVDRSEREQLIAASDRFEETTPLLMLRADTYGSIGECESAINIYQQILADEPANPSANNNLAFIIALSDCGTPALAAKAVQTAIKELGELPVLLDTKGLVLRKLGKLNEAEAEFKRSLELQVDAGTLIHLASVSLTLGNREAAKEALDQVLEVQPVVEKLHPLDRAMYEDLLVQIHGAA